LSYPSISFIYVNPDCYGKIVDIFPKTASKAVNCYVYIYSVSEIKSKKEFLQEISLGLHGIRAEILYLIFATTKVATTIATYENRDDGSINRFG